MTTVRVPVQPELLVWARERARIERAQLTKAFPRLPAWEAGETQPTLKQLEQYARRTHAPIGYFFLPSPPPPESLPIPDFRTIRNQPIAKPSVDLLETIYMCQRRQDWFREYAQVEGEEPIPFVGSMTPGSDVVEAARRMRDALAMTVETRQTLKTWEEALAAMVRHAEEAGVMVMRNGVVGNNTHRRLDREEFRGFALSDDLAPLVFINAADSKSGQMFTLAHELVHVFIGRSALSDASPRRVHDEDMERWCNQVAAEFLVPVAVFDAEYDRRQDAFHEMRRLSRLFKVSTLVALRRMYDAGGLRREEFWRRYAVELERLKDAAPRGAGGDFHATEAVRVSRRFASALIASTLEGHTMYREAFRLLGISKTATFKEFSATLGYAT